MPLSDAQVWPPRLNTWTCSPPGAPSTCTRIASPVSARINGVSGSPWTIELNWSPFSARLPAAA